MEALVAFLIVAAAAAGACAAWSTKELLDMCEEATPEVTQVQQESRQVQQEAELVQSEADDYRMTPEEMELEHYCDSLDLLAICAMAEAEGESELGKRLVIDTVLNRVDNSAFPDNIWDVIAAPGAFTSYDNGRMDRVEPTQEIFRLVVEEIHNRTNNQVLYFTAGEWSKYGTPLLQVGNHYFSGE